MARLLISPLSWGLYWITAIPVAVWPMGRTDRGRRLLLTAILAMLAFPVVGYGLLVAGVTTMIVMVRQTEGHIDSSPEPPADANSREF